MTLSISPCPSARNGYPCLREAPHGDKPHVGYRDETGHGLYWRDTPADAAREERDQLAIEEALDFTS